jgi:hypothetical protein
LIYPRREGFRGGGRGGVQSGRLANSRKDPAGPDGPAGFLVLVGASQLCGFQQRARLVSFRASAYRNYLLGLAQSLQAVNNNTSFVQLSASMVAALDYLFANGMMS